MVSADVVLTSQRLPARLTVAQAGQLLGFQEHEMGVLLRTKLLKPLGNPAPNAHKYFSSVEILALASDPSWLDKATKAVARAWQSKNAKAKGRVVETVNGPAEPENSDR